jgi:hypothetical protein
MATSTMKSGSKKTKQEIIFNPETGNYAQPLRQVPKGELIRLKDTETAPVWVKDYYDRSSKRWCCYKYEDVNHCNFFSGDRVVYTGFTY